jgi:hypothetical protein
MPPKGDSVRSCVAIASVVALLLVDDKFEQDAPTILSLLKTVTNP